MVDTLTSVQEAAVRAKKSGRLLCEEPIQIFWHSRPLRPAVQRLERFPPLNFQDPRLPAQGVEQGHIPPSDPPPQSDVSLKTVAVGVKRQRENEGEGAVEEVGEWATVMGEGGQGKKSIWERLGEKVEEVKTTKASIIPYEGRAP